MKKTGRGWAKVEFLACKQEIKKLLEQGHAISSIHNILIESGKITMSQPRFYSLIRYYKLSSPTISKLVLIKDIEMDNLGSAIAANAKKQSSVQSDNQDKSSQSIKEKLKEELKKEKKPLIEIEKDPDKQDLFF